MRKLLYSFFALLATTTFSLAQGHVGFTGSLQLATQQLKGQGITIDGTTLVGFQAGILLNSPLNENFSIRSQLLYSVKGGKYSFSSTTFTTTFNYVELPVQVMYSFDVNTGRVVAGIGPYIAYAVSGTSRAGSVSGPVDFGSKADQINRFDYGLRVSLGYELESGFGVTAYYEPGLANFANTSSATGRNSAFGLSLAYLFGTK